MGRHRGLPMITTSVRITPEFHQLAVANDLSFSECMRIGISMSLAEKGVSEYDNRLNLVRNHAQLKMRLREEMEKLAKIEAKLQSKGFKIEEDIVKDEGERT